MALSTATSPARSLVLEVIAPAEDRAPATSSSRGLAARLAAGDERALGELYDRFGRVTFGFLLNTLRDRGTAEDVQQQVFLQVWQRAASYDPARGSLLTWVMTIARSRAIDHLRRRLPEPAGGAEEVDPVAAVDDVETLVERYRIAALLSRLHPEEAEVLRLRFYDDLTQAEIAERTGIPLGTVKMRMVAALDRLRTMIEGER